MWYCNVNRTKIVTVQKRVFSGFGKKRYYQESRKRTSYADFQTFIVPLRNC